MAQTKHRNMVAVPDGPVPATGKLNYSPEVNDAVSRVRQIRANLMTLTFTWQQFGENVREAYDARDWETLGYQTWREYCAAEFSSDQLPRAPKDVLANLVSFMARSGGMSTRAIGDALGIGKSTVARLSPTVPGGTVGLDGRKRRPAGEWKVYCQACARMLPRDHDCPGPAPVPPAGAVDIDVTVIESAPETVTVDVVSKPAEPSPRDVREAAARLTKTLATVTHDTPERIATADARVILAKAATFTGHIRDWRPDLSYPQNQRAVEALRELAAAITAKLDALNN